MNDLQVLFVETVSSAMNLNLVRMGYSIGVPERKLQQQVAAGIKQMALRQQRGETFDALRYSAETLDAIESASDGQTSAHIFAGYCLFQSSILALVELPDLVKQLLKAELNEWARLEPDCNTLRPFAENFVWSLVCAFEQGAFSNQREEQEVADMIIQITELFGIVLTQVIRDRIEGCLCLEDSNDADGTSLNDLPDRRLLN